MNELLVTSFPALLEIVEDVAQSWFLSLLQQAPTPHQAQKMTRNEPHKLLKEHRIRRFDADTLLPILRQQPFSSFDPMAPPEAIEIADLVPRLQLVPSQIKDLERQMYETIEHWCQPPFETNSDSISDGEILFSVPNICRNVFSVLVPEVPEAIEQRDYQAHRTLGGVAPVTQRSGKKTVICQRRSVNSLMQNALYHWARVACQHDAKCKRKYDSLKARGKTHGQALRCVGNHLLKVICTMLQNNTLYEPELPETDTVA